MSRMGSGLKTIILVLLNLLVIPELDEYKDKKMVYGFEELENNLHPAMQRKLFEYIYEFAKYISSTLKHLRLRRMCVIINSLIFII